MLSISSDCASMQKCRPDASDPNAVDAPVVAHPDAVPPYALSAPATMPKPQAVHRHVTTRRQSRNERNPHPRPVPIPYVIHAEEANKQRFLF